MDVSGPYRLFKVSLAGKKLNNTYLRYWSQNDVKCKRKKRSIEVDLKDNLSSFLLQFFKFFIGRILIHWDGL